MNLKTFSAIIRQEKLPSGLALYVAECPEVGTVSQGESIETALSALKEV